MRYPGQRLGQRKTAQPFLIRSCGQEAISAISGRVPQGGRASGGKREKVTRKQPRACQAKVSSCWEEEGLSSLRLHAFSLCVQARRSKVPKMQQGPKQPRPCPHMPSTQVRGHTGERKMMTQPHKCSHEKELWSTGGPPRSHLVVR